MNDELNASLEVLKNGGLLLCPTDTIWGISCDATNEEAVSRIFQLKGRSEQKSLIVLLDSAHKLPSYVREIPDVAYDLIEYSEKPLTIIYSGAKNLAPNVINQDGSVGIRIVKHPFCQKLIERFRKPIVSTSANLSGVAAPAHFGEISPEIIQGVDHVVQIDQELRTAQSPSTIMKLEPGGRFAFIRK